MTRFLMLLSFGYGHSAGIVTNVNDVAEVIVGVIIGFCHIVFVAFGYMVAVSLSNSYKLKCTSK
jgi:hypothetical protein